jgi:hypothetical protein
MAITAFGKPENEKFGVAQPAEGQRRCIVVVPRKAAPGHPWSWRGCYWDHQPQAEVELLRRGFYVAYISASSTLKPDKTWEAWYTFLTEQHGLSKKPSFVGMSRGGEYAYIWATTHPDNVSCIYADNPGMNRETLMKFDGLAARDVPLLIVCGSIDPLLGDNALVMENLYQQLGGRISLMIKEGFGHHPHSLSDPKPIADWIEQNIHTAGVSPPALAGAKFTRTNYYGTENSYRYFPSEGCYISCRGPAFTNCYDRFEFNINGVMGTLSVIAPRTEAPGRPWIFRAGFADRNALVDLALLARGFNIVTGPVSYNTDSMQLNDWNRTYQLLVDNGFSKKPVLEGAGGAAGQVYGWAINNPGKVSCIYVENPVLRSSFSSAQPLDNLELLAKAGVPLLEVCGSLDPGLADNGIPLEKRYKALGGRIKLILKEGEGHDPTAAKDPKPIVDFILKYAVDGVTAAKSKMEPAGPGAGREDYRFDSTISRKLLENYLSRAITMQNLLTGQGDFDDNLRMLKSIGAKYIGRSVCQWGEEADLLKNLEKERALSARVHRMDSEIILEACIFEIVSRQIGEVPVPDWAFSALGMKPEKRNFCYDSMVYANGMMKDQWGPGSSVPDVSRPETKLMFFFLAASYIDLGIEGIHFGQVELMNKNDPHLDHYAQILSLIRAYATTHARRHMLLCNSHVPGGGFLRDGQLLMDFHAFPLRIMELAGKPQEAILKLGFSDGLYNRSKGGITYSGWACEHLPYLVEFDNYGVSKHPGQPNPGSPGSGFDWIWGYDEISWFAHQSKEYRAGWLRYAFDWVKKTDPNGFLEMPGSRTETSPLDHEQWYYANMPSPAVPDGLGDEQAIRAIWAADH